MPANQVPDLNVSPEMEKKILDWLYDEITGTKHARQPFEDHWLEIQEYYELTILENKKNFPWEGAAHLMIPLMPMYIEQIKSKVLGTLFAPSDPFAATPLRRDFNDFVKPMRKLMTWASNEEIKWRQFMGTALLEQLKLGDMVGKAVYTEDVQTYMTWDAATAQFVERTDTLRSHPELLHVPLADFFFPLHVLQLSDAQWLADRARYSWTQLQHMEREGHISGIEEIKPWEERKRTKYQNERQEPVVYEPHTFQEFELYEVWFEHPITEDGPPMKQVWRIHLDSRTALRKQHNWFPMQLNPYIMGGYEKREHRVYSTGVGQMILPYQKEISTMHNQRLDSAAITTMPIFKQKSDSLGPSDITFRVGGTVPVDEMDDLDVLFTGNPLNSTITEEQHSLSLLQQRIGMQDFLGSEAIAQANSTTVLQLIAESNRRFDEVIYNCRTFMTEAMTKLLLLYQKYYPKGKAVMLLGEDGNFIEQIWEFPEEWITQGMGIQVTATTSATSKELDMQNKMSLFGMLVQYYGNLTQYVIQAQNPQLPPSVSGVLFRIVDSLTSFVEDLLEDFNIRNAAEIAISIDAIGEQVAAAQQVALAAGVAPPPGLPGTPQPDSGNGAPAQQAGPQIQQSA